MIFPLTLNTGSKQVTDFFFKYWQCLNIIPVFEISSSLVSKKTEEGNGGLTEDCSPGGPDLPGGSVTAGSDFLGDIDPIENK